MSSTAEKTSPIFDKMAKDYEESFPQMYSFAQEALTLAPPIDSTSHVHDNACGPGIVTKAILEVNPSARIDATDISEGMVGAAQAKYATTDGRIKAQVMDSLDLKGFEDGRFTHSFSDFVFVILKPDETLKGAKEIYRTLKPGGTAVVLGWERVGWKFDFMLPILQAAAKEAGKDAFDLSALDETSAATFEKIAREAGFKDLKSEFKTRPLNGADLTKNVLKPMFGFFVGFVTKEWTEEERKRCMELIEEGKQKQKENPSTFEMKAWMMVLKK